MGSNPIVFMPFWDPSPTLYPGERRLEASERGVEMGFKEFGAMESARVEFPAQILWNSRYHVARFRFNDEITCASRMSSQFIQSKPGLLQPFLNGLYSTFESVGRSFWEITAFSSCLVKMAPSRSSSTWEYLGVERLQPLSEPKVMPCLQL